MERLHRGNRRRVYQCSAIHPDVGEPVILRGGNARVAENRLGILQSAAEQVDAEEAVRPGLHVQIVSGNILNESAAARTALDIDCVGLGLLESTMLNMHATNAAGRLAAHADACKNIVGQSAIANEYVLRR